MKILVPFGSELDNYLDFYPIITIFIAAKYNCNVANHSITVEFNLNKIEIQINSALNHQDVTVSKEDAVSDLTYN